MYVRPKLTFVSFFYVFFLNLSLRNFVLFGPSARMTDASVYDASRYRLYTMQYFYVTDEWTNKAILGVGF